MPHPARMTMTSSLTWFSWALVSAVFASLTAIFAKVGLEGIDSDYATLIRTIVIITLLAAIVFFADKWISPFKLPGKSLGFLFLSGLATGASWLCYFRALQIGEASKVASSRQTELGAGCSLRVYLPWRASLCQRMDRYSPGRLGRVHAESQEIARET